MRSRSLKWRPALASSPLCLPPEAIRIIPERVPAARGRDRVEISAAVAIDQFFAAREGRDPGDSRLASPLHALHTLHA
jgi:hypothetical protein